ncbi:MAG: acyl-CoA dehydrogenase family protein [Pseudomonadota bacterium]
MTATDDIAALIRDSAAAYVAAEDTVARARRLKTGEGACDEATFAGWSRLGWTAMLAPAAMGGGLGLAEAAALHEELGKGLAGSPLIHSAHLPILAARRCSGPAAPRVMAAIAEGVPCALAFQPAGGALDAQSGTVRVEEAGSNRRLHGEAHYVPAVGEGHLLVAARGESGVGLYRVDASAPGLRRAVARTADGQQIFSLMFDSVTIEAADLVGLPGEGGRAADVALEQARILQAAFLLGLMRATLERTLDYLKTRKQFGRPIGAFQVLQHRAVDLFVQIELTAAAVAHAVERAGESEDPLVLADAASSAKVRASEAALLVTREAVQMHGAIAYTQEHDIGLFLNQALTQAAALGNAAAHRRRYGLLIARQIAA